MLICVYFLRDLKIWQENTICGDFVKMLPYGIVLRDFLKNVKTSHTIVF